MRVDPKSPFTAPAPAAATRQSAGGQSFAVSNRGEAGRTSATTMAVPLASMDALIALQGEDDPAERRRRSVKRGNDLLDALDQLKAALLGGVVPASDLRQVAARLAERRHLSGDPQLDDLVAQIELRAEVEIAKLGARASNPGPGALA